MNPFLHSWLRYEGSLGCLFLYASFFDIERVRMKDLKQSTNVVTISFDFLAHLRSSFSRVRSFGVCIFSLRLRLFVPSLLVVCLTSLITSSRFQALSAVCPICWCFVLCGCFFIQHLSHWDGSLPPPSSLSLCFFLVDSDCTFYLSLTRVMFSSSCYCRSCCCWMLFIQRLSDLDLHPDLHLPPPNQFIAQDFSLRCLQQQQQQHQQQLQQQQQQQHQQVGFFLLLLSVFQRENPVLVRFYSCVFNLPRKAREARREARRGQTGPDG